MKRRHALVVWLFGTLLAIAFIGENAYLGLGLAITSALIFGIVNFLAFQNDE
jgi:hypothetical protein